MGRDVPRGLEVNSAEIFSLEKEAKALEDKAQALKGLDRHPEKEWDSFSVYFTVGYSVFHIP